MSLLRANDASAVTRPQPSGAKTTPQRAWRWFLALEAVLALVYFPFGLPPEKPLIFGWLPWMEWAGQVPAWALLGLSAVVAIALGVRHNRPNAEVAWWFLGGGLFLCITGDTTYKFWHQILGQQHIPFPSMIDAIYIPMYPMLAVGLLLLARAAFPAAIGPACSMRSPSPSPSACFLGSSSSARTFVRPVGCWCD